MHRSGASYRTTCTHNCVICVLLGVLHSTYSDIDCKEMRLHAQELACLLLTSFPPLPGLGPKRVSKGSCIACMVFVLHPKPRSSASREYFGLNFVCTAYRGAC